MFKVGFIVLTIVGVILLSILAVSGNLIQNKKRFIRTMFGVMGIWFAMFVLCIVKLFV